MALFRVFARRAGARTGWRCDRIILHHPTGTAAGGPAIGWSVLRLFQMTIQMTTDFHAKYWAYELTRRRAGPESDRLGPSLLDAAVDLNPHQIDAALFALRSPLAKGVLLADEVGLGKTIEAGLVISQLWAEGRRLILCIVPAALRTQWRSELAEKFFLDALILDGKNADLSPAGNPGVTPGSPTGSPTNVLICSYQFARAHQTEVGSVAWDLVVLDEAHRLRNVYKTGSKVARSIRQAVGSRRKLLLTATPLQNSLMELYGLASIIDPYLFGDEKTFRATFSAGTGVLAAGETEELRSRLHPVCQRTLRRQVTEYVRYTNRVAITQDFSPTPEERLLYEEFSTYLQDPGAHAIPARQRSLMTLVLRKILASSSFALAGTIGVLLRRLRETLDGLRDPSARLEEGLGADFELLPEMADEWEEQDLTILPAPDRRTTSEEIRRECERLEDFRRLAESITVNAKGQALLQALATAFSRAASLGAPRKALVFTESRRTQAYLRSLLEENGYRGEVVTLNGTNTDDASRAVHARWLAALAAHRGPHTVTGIPAVDVRTALVHEFEHGASVMIATEAGSEGLNLQFCSLVVNYDLPWNPQRIEQRIGRCHRYGQKHDVVVLNFLNRTNLADRRVFELLDSKLRLFSGLFGSSDETLGALGAGVDFERRIHDIYQTCRDADAIDEAFDRLQADLDDVIRARLTETRARLLEHFDEDVHARLRLNREQTQSQVERFGQWLWSLTAHELGAHASFEPDAGRFTVLTLPETLRGRRELLGRYRPVRQSAEDGCETYRLRHPLAEHLVSIARGRDLPPRTVVFDYGRHDRHDRHDRKISALQALRGGSGWLQLSLLSIEALDLEEHLLFSGIRDDGSPLEADTCRKLFSLPGRVDSPAALPPEVEALLARGCASESAAIAQGASERDRQHVESEMATLDAWADDLKMGLERDLKQLDRDLQAARAAARQPIGIEEKLAAHRRVRALEAERNRMRASLFEAQDSIDMRKDELIKLLESRLRQNVSLSLLFRLRWRVE